MLSYVLHEIGAQILPEQREIPQVSPDAALVKVAYAALNHRDCWIQKGQYAGLKFPIVLGSDLSGWLGDEEVLVNPGFYWGTNETVQSSQFQILGLPQDGALSEYVVVPKSQVHPLPSHLSLQQAAALPLAGLTAYRALVQRGGTRSGEKVLITGIGGGVALFAFQFALALGCQVVVSSSSQKKRQKAIDMGASHAYDYTDDQWTKELMKNLGGVDVIIDGAGGESFSQLIKIAKPAGRIIIYGGTQGEIQKISPQQIFWKQLSVLGSTMGSEQDFEQMLAFVEKHKIVPVIDSVYPISEVNAAMDRMRESKQFGKLILRIEQ